MRLGDELSGGTRRALAEAMVTDVLMALRRTRRVAEVLVVTSEPAAEAIGRGYGANVLVDDREEGQSAATLIGVAYALEAGRAARAARARRHARRSIPRSSTRCSTARRRAARSSSSPTATAPARTRCC